jgi:hypothetical protein
MVYHKLINYVNITNVQYIKINTINKKPPYISIKFNTPDGGESPKN